jgi:acylphosphatase
MIAKRIIFRGRVQGVGFRYAVHHLARSFEVCGWVRNLPDGSVELQAQGPREEVTDFIHDIINESNVAHHIKSHFAETIPPLTGVTGFRIVRE